MDNYNDFVNGINSQDREDKNSKIINEFKAFLKLNNSVYNTFAGVKAEIDNILNNPISVDQADYYQKLFPSFFVHLKNIKADLSFFPEYTFVPECQKLIDKHYTFIMREMTLAEAETSRNKILQLLEENKQQLPNYLNNLEYEKQRIAQENERLRIEEENQKRIVNQQRQQQEAEQKRLAEIERQQKAQENERRRIEEENRKQIEEQQRQQKESERQRLAEIERQRISQENERIRIEKENRKKIEDAIKKINSKEYIDMLFVEMHKQFSNYWDIKFGFAKSNPFEIDYKNDVSIPELKEGETRHYKSILEVYGDMIRIQTAMTLNIIKVKRTFLSDLLGLNSDRDLFRQAPKLVNNIVFNKYDVYNIKIDYYSNKVIFVLKNNGWHEMLDYRIKKDNVFLENISNDFKIARGN